MSKKSTRIDITDLVSLNISSYKGLIWLHLRRKEKTVSLTLKDFAALLSKKHLIKKAAKKHDRGKREKSKQDDTDTNDLSSDTSGEEWE